MSNRPLQRLRTGFAILIVGVFGAAVVVARGYSIEVGQFPTFVAGLGLLLGLVDLAAHVRSGRRPGGAEEPSDGHGDLQSDASQDDPAGLRRAMRYFAWMVGLLVMVGVASYPIATAVFVASFYRTEARTSWITSLLAAAAATGLIVAVSQVLGMRWPPSLLFGG